VLEVDNASLLLDKYPAIGFELAYSSFNPFEVFQDKQGFFNAKRHLKDGLIQFLHDPDHIQKEIESWRAQIDLEQVEILYIYGVGLGYYYLYLQEWIKEKKERAVIFIEDDLGAIDALLKMAHTQELLNDPQVHLSFVSDPKLWNAVLNELTQTYPGEKLEVSALKAYMGSKKRKINKMRLQLMRNAAAFSALISDVLYSHKLFANLLPNFKRWPDAFYINEMKKKFKGIPAIICGAGPSLKKSIELLKTCEQRALIFAGGSSLTALSAQGVVPHFGMALDPNYTEYLRLKPALAFEVPFLYGNRLYPEVFSTLNGPLGYIRSDTGGPCETWMEEQLKITGEPIGADLSHEALSVTTLALSLAYALGCDPIILVGVDLAYTGMHSYAGGVLVNSQIDLKTLKQNTKATERLLRKKDRHGNLVYTLVKWVMESEAISSFAKKSKESRFFNATEGGIGFRDIPYVPLKTLLHKYGSHSYDLRGLIHTHIQSAKFLQITHHQIDETLAQLHKSLLHCKDLSQEMLNEILRLETLHSPHIPSGKMVIIEEDFQSELAYDSLLGALSPLLDRLLNRAFPPTFEENPHLYIQRLKAKWVQINSTLLSQLSVF